MRSICSFYFKNEALLRLQVELPGGLPDHLFQVRRSPPGYIQGWEEVTNQAQKHGNVVCHYFRQIEVP